MVQLQEIHESDMRSQQSMTLLRAADVCVVPSIRHGLNLLPLEFAISHQDTMSEMNRKDGRKRGICILSELASCTRVMRRALHVNPRKISEIANACHQALTMTENELFRRIGIGSEAVTRVTTPRWALAVVLDLKGVHKLINPVQVPGAGLGLGNRILGMNAGFTSLDINVLAEACRAFCARLILVDYGGNIVNNDNAHMLPLTLMRLRGRISNRVQFCSHYSKSLKTIC
jgi:trehalose 6-phosphate synthase/phosphatase